MILVASQRLRWSVLSLLAFALRLCIVLGDDSGSSPQCIWRYACKLKDLSMSIDAQIATVVARERQDQKFAHATTTPRAWGNLGTQDPPATYVGSTPAAFREQLSAAMLICRWLVRCLECCLQRCLVLKLMAQISHKVASKITSATRLHRTSGSAILSMNHGRKLSAHPVWCTHHRN